MAQSGQVLDVLHRPGNVHDSNGARAFILGCIGEIRHILPRAIIEVRMDCAFFADEIVRALEALGVLYTISVPFKRFPELKVKIEKRSIWRYADRQTRFFECRWKPACWSRDRRFLFIRTREPIQRKGPVQLTLFAPYEYGHQFKVIPTNAPLSARRLLALHNGRGAQDGLFAELKSQTQMDYVPCRCLPAPAGQSDLAARRGHGAQPQSRVADVGHPSSLARTAGHPCFNCSASDYIV